MKGGFQHSVHLQFHRTDQLPQQQNKGARINHTDDHNRADTGPLYWAAMKAAKIIVTANPGNWEGDFRCVYACVVGVYSPC